MSNIVIIISCYLLYMSDYRASCETLGKYLAFTLVVQDSGAGYTVIHTEKKGTETVPLVALF